eukprot:CAMPEP_0202694126 /NCGR_PEP_ID=MMETSP1385-20130828/8062_1 /ASSEMBLY_ACC=CAM_ASM_000861 /TAXON_ID=933848 /ORGANISM="Elphidium margaritaceum" /LENGTH=352 /DNA_ID=CAMNT_0049349909 /DNA_START=45 /DNA_END=1103 /DNA_ORIENTATION=+
MSGSDWCTIESDPGVFTELIAKFGVKGAQVEELWGLDEESAKRLSPIYGLIFLFKWDKTLQTDISANVLDDVPDGVFFAKQTIHNACATQALLSILLNRADKLELGDTLNGFREFTASLDAETIGMALANQNEIRVAHNSFAQPEPIQIEHAKDDEEGEAFHFISYVPVNGILYEIDGLQKGPRLIDGCDDDTWFEKAKTVLQQRMASYAQKELRFTLLAVCQDLQQKYEQEKQWLSSKKAGQSMELDGNDYINNFPVEQIDDRLSELDDLIKNETNKREKWKNENIRRRHNYFPFVLSLLQRLGQRNVLKELSEKAKEKKKEKITRMEEEQKKRDEAKKTTSDDTNTSAAK